MTQARLLALATALATSVAFAGPASAGLIFSDSFENPVNAQNWQVYQSFGNWTASAGAGIEVQTSGTVSGVSAYDGNQYVELDSDTDRGGVSAPTNSAMTRTMNLVAGSYEVVFQYLPRTSTENDNNIEVYVDGASQSLMTNMIGDVAGTRPPITDWQEVSFGFSVDGTDNLYGLTFGAAGQGNELGGFVDAVSVTKVPVPATLAFLGLGLVGLGTVVRRRKIAV